MPILLVVVLGVLLLGMWFMRSGGMGRSGRTLGGRNYRSTGRQRPTYDDPDYRSTGSIGGRSTGTYQDAGYRPAPRPERRATSGPAYDDEEFRSGGSIGG